MAKTLSLLDQSDHSDSEVEFTINKSYADKYDQWRTKEEMQKLKDLSQDISDTSSESEEEEDPVIEKDFLKTLSLIKSKDPVIYNDSVEFFKEENVQKKPKIKKEKPMFMKDYERKLVLEREGKLSDEEEDDVPPPQPSGSEELDEITKSLRAAVDSDDENDATQDEQVGGLFQLRVKTDKEQEDEEEEYLQWMKGQKKEVDKETKKELSFLRRYWNDSELDEGEKFLRDYLLNQKFIDKDKPDGVPTYGEIVEDADTLMEEEQTLQEQEQFEHKYNFRFEEPDQEFIKRYPRTVGDSLRRVDNKRKMKRDDYSERKQREKEQKREELKRLKALKRKEIEEKFFKLKEASGREEINFDEGDIESDFDPDKHDEKMKELFDDDYYAVEEEQKPEFLHDDEIDDEDWDHWTREQASRQTSKKDFTQHLDEGDSSASEEQATDRKAEFEQEMIDSMRTGKRKGKKKSLFAKLISQPKPLYDPDGKSFEEYLDEYYNLDYEDVVGDLPVRFKYRKVIPNDFGLTADEILAANDKELNQWCSVKKTCQYRRDDEELYDVQAFQKKARNTAVKEKVLPSLYAPLQEDEVEVNTNESKSTNNAKRKRKRSKKKKSENSIANDTQGNSNEEDVAIPPAAEEIIEDFDSTLAIKDNLPDKKKKKKKKNKKSNDSITNDQQYNSVNDEPVPPAPEESIKDLNSTHAMEHNLSERKKKKRKRNSESVDKICYNASETNNAESAPENNILSSRDRMVDLDSSNTCEVDSPRKKKRRKNNKDSADSTLLSSTIPMEYSNETEKRKENGRSNSSFKVPEPAVGRNEQSNSPSKKSKKKRKRNRSRSDGNTGNQFKSSSKSQQALFQSDKRLAVSDSRLAAFGINPKKFKSSIIYSKK